MLKPVIYIHARLMSSSKKCVKALDYIDNNRRITKNEMRKHIKGIFYDLHGALDVPTKFDHDTDNHETKEEREKMPDEYYKSIEGFDLPDGF